MENRSCQNIGHLCDSHIYMPRPEDMLTPQAINPSFVPILLTHTVTFLVGVLSNGVVIVTWAGSRSSRSPTCTFLVSLAVADLLLLVLYVPLETLGYFVITWDTGGATCKLSSYVEMLSGVASVLNLVAVSCERFLVIVFPIKARRFCTLNNCRRGLVVVWVLAFVLATPVLVTKRIHPLTYYNNVTSLTAYYCWDNNDYLAFAVAIYQLVTIFALPALLMSICYACVIRVLWSSTKTVAAMTSPYVKPQLVRFCQGRHQKAAQQNGIHISGKQGVDVRQARKQVIKMLILVILLFLICWGPRLVFNIAIKQGLPNYNYSAYTARISFYLLSFIHSTLNPFVYGFMSSNFRRMMVQSCSQEMAMVLTCRRGMRKSSRHFDSDTREFSTYVSSVRRSKQYGSCKAEVRLCTRPITDEPAKATV